MLGLKNISWPSFFIGLGGGFIVGVLALGILVNYLFSHALYATSGGSGPLAGAINQVRSGIAHVNAEQESHTIYGKLVSIGDGTLVLEAVRSDGEKQFTFTYDNSTTFVYLANDAASSEVPLSADAIDQGTGLTIYTNEAVGSVANQHAVKVVKI